MDRRVQAIASAVVDLALVRQDSYRLVYYLDLDHHGLGLMTLSQVASSCQDLSFQIYWSVDCCQSCLHLRYRTVLVYALRTCAVFLLDPSLLELVVLLVSVHGLCLHLRLQKTRPSCLSRGCRELQQAAFETE